MYFEKMIQGGTVKAEALGAAWNGGLHRTVNN